MLRVFVTGVSGFIGQNLSIHLKDRGYKVIGIGRDPNPNLSIDDFIQCDLLDQDRYRAVLQNVDHICHLAAAKGDWGISKEEYYRDNLEATRALLEAGHRANVKKWIFYSTVSALGPSDAPMAEDAPRHPINAYGQSKAACEELFDQYVAEVRDAHVVTIRPSVVFGPGNPWNTNVFRLIDAIYRDRFVMVGSGRQVKTTCYIDNLIEAHTFLMDRQLACPETGHEIFHYVDTPQLTTAELVAQIAGCLGKRPPRLRIPLALAAPLAAIGDAAAALTGIDLPITSARVRKFCRATNFSAEKIRRLGFRQPISNEEAMRRTVKWYLDTEAGS